MVDVYCHTTPILMAKRFIDTDLFRKPFMRSLEAPYKALWIYLLCECDHAGVWVVEMDVAQIRMGLKLDPDKVMEKMCGSVVAIDGGSKWYLPDFVAFQYGTLNPSNKVHGSVIERLSRYGIDPNEPPENKPLTSPLQGAKDKDKDKELDKDKDMDKYITVENEKIYDPMVILEYYEAPLNGRQREHNTRNWRDVVPEWFETVLHIDYNDNKHLFNAFSKYLLSLNKPGGKPAAKLVDLTNL